MGQKEDVDVEYFWRLDMMPKWIKILSLPFTIPGAGMELGPKGLIDLLLRRSVRGHHVDLQVGSIPLEAAVWVTVHHLSLDMRVCTSPRAWCSYLPRRWRTPY